MRRYKNYKTTQYDWLLKVPGHWKSRSIRSLTELSSVRKGNSSAELLSVYREYGVIPKASRDDNHNVESADLSNYKVVRPGDLVMNKMKMWQGSLGISRYAGIVSPAYIVCHIMDKKVNRSYLHMLLRSTPFKTYYNRMSYGVRVGQWDMRYTDFKNLLLYLPPLEEQDQIVRYLDWKVSEIDRLIAIKKEEIKRILELKEAFISHAFHFEKNSDRWDIRPLKWFVTSNDESLSASTPESYEIRYLDISSVGYGRLNHEPTRMTFGGAPSRARRIVREGDTIISTVRTYLKSVCFIDSSLDECIASTGFSVLRPRENVHSPLLGFALTTNFFINEVIANSIGIAYPAIADTKLMSLKIALPRSIEEQQLLYMSLKDKAHSYDKGIEYLTETIHKLHDIKSRLISDVVTGQIDVRDVKVPDFDFIEEEFDENFDEDIENSDFNNEED